MKQLGLIAILLLSAGKLFADFDGSPDEQLLKPINDLKNDPIGFNSSRNAYCTLSPLNEKLCETLFQKAPQAIRDCVTLIDGEKKGKFNIWDSKRFEGTMPTKLLLVGKPGVGKTTLAQVMAQKLDRSAILIRAPMLGNEYKNSESNNLMRVFDPILNSFKPCVVIIDEINILAEPRRDASGTDSSAAATLWLLLDMCAQNPNILIIGTTNDATNLPEQLKDRFEGSVIEVTFNDRQARFEILSFYFSKRFHLCDSAYMWRLANKTENLSPRQLEALVIAAQQNQMIRDPHGFINEIDIEKAYQKFVLSSKVLKTKLSFSIKNWIQENSVIIQTISSSVNLALVIASLGYVAISGKSIPCK